MIHAASNGYLPNRHVWIADFANDRLGLTDRTGRDRKAMRQLYYWAKQGWFQAVLAGPPESRWSQYAVPESETLVIEFMWNFVGAGVFSPAQASVIAHRLVKSIAETSSPAVELDRGLWLVVETARPSAAPFVPETDRLRSDLQRLSAENAALRSALARIGSIVGDASAGPHN